MNWPIVPGYPGESAVVVVVVVVVAVVVWWLQKVRVSGRVQ